MFPTQNEPERVAVSDHDPRHGNRYGRHTVAYARAAAGLSQTHCGSRFRAVGAEERYDFLTRIQRRFGYARLRRAEKRARVRPR